MTNKNVPEINLNKKKKFEQKKVVKKEKGCIRLWIPPPVKKTHLNILINNLLHFNFLRNES